MSSPWHTHLLLPPPVDIRMEMWWRRPPPPSICQSECRCHFVTVSLLFIFLSGTQIYCLNGTDPEGQEVRYGLSFDPGSKEYFRVEPISGNVTLVEQLDREVNCLQSPWWNNSISSTFFYFIFPILHESFQTCFRNKTLLTFLSASQMDEARY